MDARSHTCKSHDFIPRYDIMKWNPCLCPCASHQIRKIQCCAWSGNAGNVFHARWLQRKLLVSDPGMHYSTCITQVPWWMSESLTHGGGEIVPGIPGACATRNFTYLVRGSCPSAATAWSLSNCSLACHRCVLAYACYSLLLIARCCQSKVSINVEFVVVLHRDIQ